jgi:exodeoxyribonuclease V alpha subunit
LAYKVDRKPEVIKGIIERIVFLNEENGFAIAKIRLTQGALPPDSRDGLATILGTMPSLSAGESIRAYGVWESDPRYGTQFRVFKYETLLPASIAGIKRYLASGLIKGIGDKTAEKLVRKFGAKTLDVIENEPQRLLEVDGIGEWRASLIVKGWKEQKEIRDVMMFLQSHNVSPALAVKIYRHYGNEAISLPRIYSG